MFWNEEQGLLSKLENCEHLKNFKNVDCEVTNHNQNEGAFFLGKSKSGVPNPKTDFSFLGQIQKRNMNA